MRNLFAAIVLTVGAVTALAFATPVLHAQDQAPASPLSRANTPRQATIVGGQPADPGEWPWQAMVLPGPYLCGGSLVAPQWIVTAAHCLESPSGGYFDPSEVSVVLGEYDTSQADGTEQDFQVSRVIPHPDYDPNTSENDIALLELSTPATLNASVGTIPLLTSPGEDALVATGKLTTVTGWGDTTYEGSISPVLREVEVPVVSNSVCNADYGGGITGSMLCAGFAAGGKDACQGDSGGPLVAPTGGGSWRLAGVVSFGSGCALPDTPGVYTRVSSFVSWINQYLEESSVAVNDFAPTSGPQGTVVTINGANLGGVSAVRFNGVDAAFEQLSDTQVSATVPAGSTTGKITVVGASGSGSSGSSFTVMHNLTVSMDGEGSGTVTSNPAGIDCGAGCVALFGGGGSVSLTAVPAEGSVVTGWSGGGCVGTATICTFSVGGDTTVVVSFGPPPVASIYLPNISLNRAAAQ